MTKTHSKIKKVFLPSILSLLITPTLQANSFWKSDLNENLTNITKRQYVDYFTSNVDGKLWPGIGPNGEAPGTTHLYYSRIPAMAVTEDNKMVVMFDLRWNRATDQDRIDPGVAISNDGGHTWEKKTAWTFNDSKMPTRRAMDPTILHNPIDGSLYVMHGTWAGGSQNWYQDRFNYFNQNLWATTIYKSSDGGNTWEKNAEFSKQSNSKIFEKVQKGQYNPTIAFLGGVGSGIVMRDGTLVFPVQTAHYSGIATTIMYSKDNGKTWDMPETMDALAPNQISLENMVFEIDGKLVMTGRESRVGSSNAGPRWAYYTEDLGKTWHTYTPVDGFGSSTAQPTQGSSIYVTLPNGRRVLLISKPNGNDDNWARGNLALWMLDAKNPEHAHQVAIIRPGSGNPAGAGYSSLAYKEGNLFIAFEDDGDITVKNLTEYMDEIQKKSIEWNLPDEIEKEVENINALSHLNKGQKDNLIAKIRRANDNAIAQSIAIDQAMEDLKAKTASLNEQSKSFSTALPSKLNQFKNDLNSVNSITDTNSSTHANYVDIQDIYNNLYDSFLALNTKLDFSKYVSKALQFNEYNHDILYRSFNNLFAHYDVGSKYNRLALGINTNVNDNLKAGLFFEHRNKTVNSYEIGARAKYQKNNHLLSGFVRYRGVKYQNMLERNNNLDIYLNYAYQLQLNEQFSLAPSIGGYISRSSRTLIDEDVAINQRTVYAGDVGLNINYKFDNINFNIRPNVAFINDGITLSQSNYDKNTHKIKSDNVVYGLSTGIEKQFQNGLAIGSTLNLQKYGSQYSNVNLGVDISYKW